jgi:hypothetical protein
MGLERLCVGRVAEDDVNHRDYCLELVKLGPSNSPHPSMHPTIVSHRDDHSIAMRAFLQDLTAPPAQTLRTLHPTPSTVSYTVSTRPIRNTIIASLAHHAGLVLRIVVGLATVLFVWVKWSVTFEKSTSILAWVFGNRHTAQRLQLGEVCQWRYLAPAAAFILFLVFRRNYTGIVSCLLSLA